MSEFKSKFKNFGITKMSKDKEDKVNEFINGAVGETLKKVPNPKGQPKKAIKRDEKLVIYLTKEQKEDIIKRAEKNGMSASSFLISKALI